MPRKLVAVLYADVAGYSRSTASDEDESHRTLSDYLDLIAGAIAGGHGQVMHYAGDAVLAMFEAAVDALACASRIQAEIGRRNELLPEGRRIAFRIGLNLGDVILDRGDMYGNGVNVAARLEALAAPGGIAFSESFQTALRGQPNIKSLRLGRRRVKNIADPIGIYTLAEDPTARAWRRTRRARTLALAAGGIFTVFVLVAAWRGGWLDWSQPQPV
ncbi:MAG TPA: adenylate/guanylate cyclase domain-containing protein, partial [Gammaproteobacteria bacterium]|nr:adenylate/guanylate cyclase domain-containing protein [Gammaproteobacteria bacterium]